MSELPRLESSVTIRRFEPPDAPALRSIFYTAIHQLACADYTPVQLAAWAPTELGTAQWSARMERRNPFVAEWNGHAVGYADVQRDGFIDHFFVSPTVARRGVGSALMRRILQEAQRRQIPLLFSEVSITARPLFEHFGFRVENFQTVIINGVSLSNQRMTKRLEGCVPV